MQNLSVVESQILRCQRIDFDLVVHELRLDAQLVEHVDFVGQVLHELGIQLDVEAIEPEVLDEVHERSDNRLHGAGSP